MRSCGACTACCTLTAVPELRKPFGVTCEHCDGGCRIYSGRPSSCETFACAWLAGAFAENARPDLSGVMVEEHPLMIAVLLLPGRQTKDIPPGVFEELDAYRDAGRPVIASGMFALLPPGMTGAEAKARLLRTIASTAPGGLT